MILALTMIAAIAGPLDELPPQLLTPGRCALFLWDRASQRRIAMATTDPSALTIVRNGRTERLGRDGDPSTTTPGFAAHTVYRNDDLSIATDVSITPTEAGGGVVRDGTLTITLADGTAIVRPVAGLIGCQ